MFLSLDIFAINLANKMEGSLNAEEDGLLKSDGKDHKYSLLYLGS